MPHRSLSERVDSTGVKTWPAICLQVEKHIRKNKLTAGTFSDQVGASSRADDESTDREARKLAFFLYWNIKPTFARFCRQLLTILYLVLLHRF